jgi:hypothetical protein
MNPFQSANQKDERPKSEQVTRVIRRVQDGRLFERTGEKRQLQDREYHWCDGAASAPIEYEPTFWKGRPDRWCESCGHSDRAHIKAYERSAETQAIRLQCPHVCAVWKLAEDQSQDETALHPKPPAQPDNPVDRLIQRVEQTPESIDEASILTRAAILGSLYQAKALERISETLHRICDMTAALLARTGAVAHLSDPLRSESRPVCSMCNFGEHSLCSGGYACDCPICKRPPQNGDQVLHAFEVLEDKHFCTRCGAGRLHSIHR